jgi:hypothetical protein
VPEPMISATRAVGPGAVIGDPADALDELRDHIMKDLSVEPGLPFGAGPRRSAQITPVDAPPPRAARPGTPAWAARRVLDTLSGRGLLHPPDRLVLEMIDSPTLVFLKQFRDVACPTKACYQAVVEAPLGVHALGAHYEPLDPALYGIAFGEYASHPIASELGITPEQPLVPDIAFRAQFDFDIDLGLEVWRALT